MPGPDEKAASRYVVAVLFALLAVPATYAALRGYDVLFKNEPSPATVIWSAKIAMFWRLGVGLYVAGMVAPFGFLVARADMQRAVRVLTGGAVVVAAMITLQGLFLP